jgi:HEAT repeat protein
VWLTETQLKAASVQELIGFLDSSHDRVRTAAARELVNRNEQPEVVWQSVLAKRSDECWMVRLQAPRAAVHLKAPPEQAIPVLQTLLDDPNEYVRDYAEWALKHFGQGN